MLRWTLGYTCLFPFWFPQCVCPAVGLLDHNLFLFFNWLHTLWLPFHVATMLWYFKERKQKDNLGSALVWLIYILKIIFWQLACMKHSNLANICHLYCCYRFVPCSPDILTKSVSCDSHFKNDYKYTGYL